jgi:hypothetical protein
MSMYTVRPTDSLYGIGNSGNWSLSIFALNWPSWFNTSTADFAAFGVLKVRVAHPLYVPFRDRGFSIFSIWFENVHRNVELPSASRFLILGSVMCA